MCSNRNKLSYEKIKPFFEDVGYIPVSIEIINDRSYINYICPEGHNGKTTLGNWKKGKRCGTCFGNNKPTYESIKKSFEIAGCKLLSPVYINSRTDLEYFCYHCGQHRKIKWNNWHGGQRCQCQSKYRNRYTDEQVHQLFEIEGYKLLSTFINIKTHLKYICPNGYNHKITLNNWNRGCRCPCELCSNTGSSQQEREIQTYIEIHHSDVQMFRNDRTMIVNPGTGKYLELDVWMPEIKKAIEYDADYYHNDDYSKYKKSVKEQYCKDNGIILLNIDHIEWIKNKNWLMIDNFVNDRKVA